MAVDEGGFSELLSGGEVGVARISFASLESKKGRGGSSLERRILESAEMGREAARRRGLRAEGAASRRATRRGATAAREARSAAPGVMPGARAEAARARAGADAATPRAAIIAGVIAPIILRGLATAPPRCMQRTDVAEGESFIARRFLAKSGVGARERARSVGEGETVSSGASTT